MQKYFSKIVFGLCATLLYWFLMPQIAVAQFPTFEYYSSHSYPDACELPTDCVATDTYTAVVFTAKVTDISGVNSVNAILKDANGNQIGDWEKMYDDGYHEDMLAGDNIYGAFFSLENLDVNGTYYLTLRAIDNLYNSSYVRNPDNSYTEVYDRVTTVTMRPVYCKPDAEGTLPRLCIKMDVTRPTTIATLTATPNSMENPEPVTLTATLSKAVANQLITFKDLTTGQIIGYGFTNASGSVSTTYVPTTSATLQAVYMGDYLRKLPPSYKETGVTVTNSGTCQTSGSVVLCLAPVNVSNPGTIQSLTMDVSGSIVAGQEVTFTATMAPSAARAGERIYFLDNDVGVLLGSSLTDANGQATFTYKPAYAAALGRMIVAIYPGNPLLKLDPSYRGVVLFVTGTCADSGSVSLCIEPDFRNPNTISSFTLSATNNQMLLSGWVTLTAQLSTATAGQTITFIDRGSDGLASTPIGTAVTDATGRQYSPISQYSRALTLWKHYIKVTI